MVAVSVKKRESALTKKLHRVTHFTKEEMVLILRDVRIEYQKCLNQHSATFNSCGMSALTRDFSIKKKISPFLSMQALAQYIQAICKVADILCEA